MSSILCLQVLSPSNLLQLWVAVKRKILDLLLLRLLVLMLILINLFQLLLLGAAVPIAGIDDPVSRQDFSMRDCWRSLTFVYLRISPGENTADIRTTVCLMLLGMVTPLAIELKGIALRRREVLQMGPRRENQTTYDAKKSSDVVLQWWL